MIPFNIIPKPLRTLAFVVGGGIAVLTLCKLYTDIKINKKRLEDYEAGE